LHEFFLKISTTLSLPMTDRKFNRMVVRMEPFVLALGSGFYLRVSGKSVQLPWATSADMPIWRGLNKLRRLMPWAKDWPP
jgi:hypothetical protein